MSDISTVTSSSVISQKSSEIWAIADLLRGAFKSTEYGRVMLPFIVLKRLDTVLAEKDANGVSKHDRALALYNALSTAGMSAEDIDTAIYTRIGVPYYNTSNFTFGNLIADPNNIAANLNKYFTSYSNEVVEIINNFEFKNIVNKLDKSNLLYSVFSAFNNMNLSPETVSNIDMGYIFEEILRKFSEMTNETAGEHYTPRSIVRLCVELAIGLDDELTGEEDVKKIYDPTCGTGGILTVADEVMKDLHGNMLTELYGQELNPESYAIAKADLLMKGYDSSRITLGSTLSEDKLENLVADYIIANPPYGTSWKNDEAFVKNEAKTLGFDGRFGAGTPSVSDGQLLFLQHMISKMNPTGARLAVVHNGSPLTNGDAGSGESNIRKWIIDNDLLVAIVALPTDMFYNTKIKTYIWVLDNTKEVRRKGKVQFIDASRQYFKMKKALGEKRHDMNAENINFVKDIYNQFDQADTEYSKIVTNEELMYRKVTVDVPQVDDDGNVVNDKKGNPVIDKSQRDSEKVPFTEDVADYMKSEVLPHVPNAIWDEGKIGAEFPLDQYFYKYEPLPSTEEIETELNASVLKIQQMMKELFD